jgi:hypothetical protein
MEHHRQAAWGGPDLTGWVSIERDLFKHDFFAREPMSEREAWMWMIAHAAWADTRHKVGQGMFDVPRGSFMATLRELQSAWMWGSDKRVRNFLKRLEGENMIGCEVAAKGNAQKTHITICKYDEFQTSERTPDARKNARGTHAGRTKETREQDNNTEANASGGQAAMNGMGEDFAKQLFDRGVDFLSRHGTNPRTARNFVGKLRKDNPDAAIFDAFAACSKAGAVDPIPWITARLGKPKTQTDMLDKVFADLMKGPPQ